MSISMIIWTIVLFLIFRFLIKYVLPLVRITKVMGGRLRQMQDQANSNGQKVDAKQTTTPRANKNDYIDYEEIK